MRHVSLPFPILSDWRFPVSPQADRAPAFQFYARDFLSDVRVMAMSLEEVGAYWKLVSICWIEEGLPSDLPVLARLLHVTPAKLRKLWPAIEPCFRLRDGLYQHPRLDRERAKQDEYRRKQSEKGKKSAEARFNHGSTTVQPEGNRTQTERQPEGNSSSSSSTASASASATAVKSVYTRTREAGAMGSSYLAASSIAFQHRGHTLNRGPHYSAFVDRFGGDAAAFDAWLKVEIDAAYQMGARPGNLFKFIDERWEKKTPNTLSTSKTAGNIAALQDFVKAGNR